MFRVVTLATGFALTASFSLAQESASFEALGDLPGGQTGSWAIAVSTDGSVVSGLSSSENGSQEAMRWENGMMAGLGDLPGDSFYSVAYDVSSDGLVVVGSSIGEEGPEAYRWQDDEMTGLGDLPGGDFYSEANGVSVDGTVVVGVSRSGEWPHGVEAFRWEADTDTMVGLGDFPGGNFNSVAYDASADGSVLVGYGTFGTSEEDTEAFRWEAGVDTLMGLGDLPEGIFSSVAWAVSSDGSVVVGQSTSANGPEAFRWMENGGMQGLGDLPGGFFFSYAQAVSADGSLVGGYSFTTTSAVEAFIWTEAAGIRRFKDVLEEEYSLDLTGWTLVSVRDISDDGMVLVGEGINTRGESEGWRVVLEEPVENETGPEEVADVLSAPAPNPVREKATLVLAVEHVQSVTVGVFDTTGRRVQTLYSGFLAPGIREMLTLDTSALSAGVYVIRATGEDFTQTRHVTVID